jgi:hypothetical protein
MYRFGKHQFCDDDPIIEIIELVSKKGMTISN